MTAADLASWLLTYAVHSTVLLGGVWLLARHPRFGEPVLQDALWKAALVGGFVTATLASALGPASWLPRAGAVLADIATAAREETYASAVAPALAPSPHAATEGRFDDVSVQMTSSAPSEVPAFAPAMVEDAPADAAPFDPAPLAPLALAAWAALAGAALLRLGVARVRLARWLAPRRDVDDPELLAALADLAAAADVRGAVRLTCSDELASPIALGRREICLPRGALQELDPAQLRSVLAHELAHLVRRDPLWLALAVCLERVFFFQPLNRLARHRMQDAAEFLCDEWAARRSGTGMVLATSLVRVAEWLQTDGRGAWGTAGAAPEALPLAGMAERPSQLLRRVQRLMETDATAPAAGRVRPRLAAAGLVFATVTLVPGIGLAERVQDEQPGGFAVAADAPSLVQDEDDRNVDVDTEGAESAEPMPAPVPKPAPQANSGATAGDSLPPARRSAALLRATLQDTTAKGRRIRALIEALSDRDAGVRQAAASALGEIEDPRAARPLAGALQDPSPEVRKAAVEALGQIEDPAAVPALVSLLRDGDAEVRQMAAHSLGQIEDRRATRPLLPLLKDESPKVRQMAAYALGQLEDPAATDALTEALKDSSPEVRKLAAHGLGQLEDPRAVPALRTLVGDPDAEVQKLAVHALGQIRTTEALDALVAAMKSPNAEVRRHAAAALGNHD